ncbi:MAG: lipopolysaccharide biosynthesis protein [Bacteroidetes Order II. Incertae sedis bacterium]|jgi:tyrosine-protein kinase Etk/Wzc|nr:lipopolysaccharide biosynthesis protein [Bacteroidetes Order II. bacterium]MBT4601862.1 lipopolysaccharide biosynthesis protein [Bacteroidetes Order II. bacterium]MBT5249349.1 lipopolysaccharide biosynthesis protein [Bacteroidetes Order II. bacterium]MBT6200200.1 lipopolysaccharide biosynthesis protein [Bacteroidetes Order II. bacterium]MBT6425214.1 lipopolysaccharide biosynthesis protein [Bacteroidetes Order II. bacterium]
MNDQNTTNVDDTWWHMLGVLFRWRRFIIIVTGVLAVVSVVISLMLPVWYKASSRLLLPNSGGSGIASALLGDLSSAAESLLGGGGGDYVRYMAILHSRAVKEQIVERFDLINVYDLAEEEFASEEALSALADNIEFVIDDEYDFMSIEVFDQDAQRAADISNYFIELLDEENNRLTRQTAGNFRAYVESRYDLAEEERGAMLDSLASFQRKYGVIDLEAQTEAYFSQLAELRASTLQYEIQLNGMRAQFGEGNQQVKNMQSMVEAANQSFQDALDGREMVMPVSQEEAPEMVRQFLNLTMERTIQERILELVAPMLEQARFEEERQSETLQVVDAAVAPFEKAKPKRMIIVIGATLSAFILALVFVLLLDWWKRNSPRFASRIREASA